MNELFAAISERAAARSRAAEDYIDPASGLRHCGKCRTPKEALFPPELQAQGFYKHPCLCRCAAEQQEREAAEQEALARRRRIDALRREAFRDIPAALWRFEQAAVQTPQLDKARRYAESWDAFYRDGIGLLLFGGVGTGKSYAAGCIANALLEREVSVLFLSMTDAVSRMQGSFGADRDAYLKSLMRPDLLILDDLGAERSTSYGRERVFDVVNQRWLSRKPMLVTTNLALKHMKTTAELEERRIYDRILEVCAPIAFTGESFRKSNAAGNLKRAAQYLSGAADSR